MTKEQKDFIVRHYPSKGKLWCCEQLSLTEGQVRSFCSQQKLKLDKTSDFFKDFQKRAKESKIGQKRPIQSKIMKEKAKNGLLDKFIISTDEKKKKHSEYQKEWIKKNGHPKGMLGKTHSQENKLKTSEKSKEMWSNSESKVNTDAHRQMLSDRASKQSNLRLEENPTSVYSRSKKGTITIGGKTIFARSSWEANVAAYLQFLKDNNEIKDWEHEPKTFWFLKIKRGVRSYKPDFLITNKDGSQYYEEVKGWMDGKSKTKLNRMRIYYPEIEVRVLGKDRYASISKNKSFIPNWGLLG